MLQHWKVRRMRAVRDDLNTSDKDNEKRPDEEKFKRMDNEDDDDGKEEGVVQVSKVRRNAKASTLESSSDESGAENDDLNASHDDDKEQPDEEKPKHVGNEDGDDSKEEFANPNKVRITKASVLESSSDEKGIGDYDLNSAGNSIEE